MELILTKDAQKLFAAAYKEYLEKINGGAETEAAKYFSAKDMRIKYFPDLSLSDYKKMVKEMCQALECLNFISGDFVLNDVSIICMENEFRNGVTGISSFLA